MDALVAQYARPAFENEGYSYEEQRELSQTVPSLSLNFALPPLPNVSFLSTCSKMVGNMQQNISTQNLDLYFLPAFCLPSSTYR